MWYWIENNLKKKKVHNFLSFEVFLMIGSHDLRKLQFHSCKSFLLFSFIDMRVNIDVFVHSWQASGHLLTLHLISIAFLNSTVLKIQKSFTAFKFNNLCKNRQIAACHSRNSQKKGSKKDFNWKIFEIPKSI